MDDFDTNRLDPAERAQLQYDMWVYFQIDRLPNTRAEMDQLLFWKELDLDVLEAYNDWVEVIRQRAQETGLEWTRENCDKYGWWDA
ncbi:hypothetical protein [Mycobacteroides salmoniphilum]|uniref:Uncharacterized protein n=1 Tax=Mycobacteroides salmoniphilum TaxID=404941 RepID=A0A4R8SVF4_9MYCO|nr:hypothetical protein [Mycobacteroides salmoniphilum]TEA06276.1 hypothetical protein CCUG60884_01414 [Mycobacteroides salmoniphilum]